MNKTLRISFSLKNTYRVNSILYSIKQIPLIKKIIPAGIYGIWGFKILANIVSVFKEILSAFLGKFFYFLCVIFLATKLYNNNAPDDLFLHIIFFLSIIGSFMNSYLFKPTMDKYYGIILMRMDARMYALVDYGYSILKIVVGFFIFGFLFGSLVGLQGWMCLMITPFVVGLKLTVAAYGLYYYEKTGDINPGDKYEKIQIASILILLAAAYGLPILNIVLPKWLTILLMFIPIVTGVLSIRKIYNFRFYRECYQQILQDVVFQKDAVNTIMRDMNNKLISTDVSIASERKGFEYFNELFIKRHHKILWKSSKKIAVICVGLILTGLILIFKTPKVGEVLNSFILFRLPWFVFIMYIINRGTGFTRVLFMNCDHSLFTYSFYKQPKFVLRLFSIRLREIMKVNLLPAVIIGMGLALLLYVSGGTEEIINYVVLVLSIPLLSMFFSVHYLTIYYLIQPYNAGIQMKSATYQFINIAIYVFCFNITKLEVSTQLFGVMTIVFCLMYCLVACVLVYKVAPKTFKLRK